MLIETVCADCGINVPFDLQHGVRTPDGDIKIVCEECVNNYNFDNDTQNNPS